MIFENNQKYLKNVKSRILFDSMYDSRSTPTIIFDIFHNLFRNLSSRGDLISRYGKIFWK